MNKKLSFYRESGPRDSACGNCVLLRLSADGIPLCYLLHTVFLCVRVLQQSYRQHPSVDTCLFTWAFARTLPNFHGDAPYHTWAVENTPLDRLHLDG